MTAEEILMLKLWMESETVSLYDIHQSVKLIEKL